MEAGTVPLGAPTGALRGASPALLRLASDNHLVRLVRAGRETAFEVVYDRYHRQILAFCAHLLGDRHEAEDAAQHAFLAAYNSLLEHDRPIQLRPWLFTIARNRCFTVLRARREVAVSEMVEGEGENPASVVQRREDLRDLVFDVRRLPEDQRAALVMAELSALSHDEIALALEVPREKVKALVFQARESLVATRTAREADCAEIRQELSSLRGPALRRSHLRRHLHACEGCQEYRSQLRHQRARLAALLPVVPSVALKDAVLRGIVGARSAAPGAGARVGAGAGAGAAAGSSALKLALVKPALVAVLSATGAVMFAHVVLHHHRPAVLNASRTPVLPSTRHSHRASAARRHRADRILAARPAQAVRHRRAAGIAERRRHRRRWHLIRHHRHEVRRHRVEPASPRPAPPSPRPTPAAVPVAAAPSTQQPREAGDRTSQTEHSTNQTAPAQPSGGSSASTSTSSDTHRRRERDHRSHAPHAADVPHTRQSSDRYRVSTTSTRRTAQWQKHHGPLRAR